MDQDILRTDVDDFIELVRKNGKMTLSEAAKTLKLTEKTIEAWTDFLVEEKILGVEYKFTTAYVYMCSEEQKRTEAGFSDFDTKEEFYEKAKKKNIPDYQIKVLWIKYISQNEEKIKAYFYSRCKDRGLSDDKTEELWKKYYRHLRSD